MNQIRTFLLIAWLMVAFLLWQEWGKEHAPVDAPAATATTSAPRPDGSVGVPVAQAGPVTAPAADHRHFSAHRQVPRPLRLSLAWGR